MPTPIQAEVIALFNTLMQTVNVTAEAGPVPPLGNPPSVQTIKPHIEAGKELLPEVFQSTYVEPLEKRLKALVASANRANDSSTLESMTGAVYQHENNPLSSPLNRFLAVISDIYRSFLSKEKRAIANLPMTETLPPLAMFQHSAGGGPFTIPVDDVASMKGGSVGVVSMPATYSGAPLLWAALGHETGGHDVTHADANLLPELRQGVRAMFTATNDALLGELWDYWMDEAAGTIHTPNPIPWPAGKAPAARAVPTPDPNAALPQCDFVIITWTKDEANSLASVMTPGVIAAPSKTDPPSAPAWFPYRHNWENFVGRLRADSPAMEAGRLGRYYMSRIGEGAGAIDVLCFKSEMHLAQDGPALPLPDLFRQVIAETQARLVVTTGTAGAIGAKLKLGDVVVASQCRFDLMKSFKSEPFNGQLVKSAAVTQQMINQFTLANQTLLAANAAHLSPQRSGTPSIFWSSAELGEPVVVVTTDKFAFDDADNNFKLQGLGAMVEMDDALLGLVCSQLENPPVWLAIRNASDPQMSGDSLSAEASQATAIYTKFGFWTTVPSAIASWAAVTGF